MFALHCVGTRNVRVPLWMGLCLIGLAACGNGRGTLTEGSGQQASYSIGGTLTGLTGSGLVLQNNAGNDLALSADGTFSFTGTLATGAAYAVTVLTQPTNPAQTCSVTNGSGTVANTNVTSVSVTCTTGTFPVGGNVTGLVGTGLVLQNNGRDDLPIAGDGGFTFATPITTGATYSVGIKTQPTNPVQTCTVTNATGTIQGAVTNVTVTCATSAFSVGGTVTGLTGSGLVLQNNGTEDLPVAQNGSFTFTTPIASGAPYNVTVKTQPSNPLQTCAVANGTGTVSNASISNVQVSCTTSLFTIGGTVSGLSGTGLVLQVNGGDDRAVNMDGAFTFATAVPEGTHYSVSVKTSPTNPSQTCTIENGSGVVATAAVTNIAVTCRTDSFQIGGTVNGLDGTGLVLQNNGADDLTVASNGSFTFTHELVSGASYHVTVRTQPLNKSQTCTIANATGTVGNGDVRNVRVSCATNTYQIRGTVTGLVGHGLVLRNNGDDIGIDGDGGFTFAREVASGGGYNVTVQHQPSDPTQACSVANGNGIVTSADITNVTVTCVTSQFSIGGTVTGLQGNATPLVLRNNGTEDVTVQSDGVFAFPTPLLSGTAYNVQVVAQPTGPLEACNVSNASGTVRGSNVTNINVQCLRIGFAVGGVVSGLAGRNLVIQNNGGDDLAIAADGPFTLPDTLPEGSSYNITVRSQPDNPWQQCVVTNGSGVVGTTDIRSVSIACTTSTFTIGGEVKGLKEGEDTGSLILLNNGGDGLQVGDDGPFTFPTPILSGASYAVSISGQPSGRICTIDHAAGTVTDHNVTDTRVQCHHDDGGGV
jgi:hypothetical protein